MRTLSHEEIRACARGCFAVETEDGAAVFRRFPPQTLAHYETRSEGAKIRAHCPAGVVLDFRTNSDRIEIRARVGAGARTTVFFNLLADGVFAAVLGANEPGETVEGVLPCPHAGPARERHLRLYLPHMRFVALASVALSDNASFAPSPPAPLLLALGDSITQGMSCLHPALAYPMVAARALGMDLLNQGVGGHVFDAAGLAETPVADPALVTVAYGTNDWSGGRDPETARAYLARLRGLYPETPVAVLEPIFRVGADDPEPPMNPRGLTLAASRALLRTVISDFPGMRCLRYEDLLPAGPSFLPDKVHPDTAGHAVYGMNLARLLGSCAR